MSPLPRNRICAYQHLPVKHNAATDTCPEDRAKYNRGPLARAIDSFGQCKTICVICDFHRNTDSSFHIPAQVTAAQPDRIPKRYFPGFHIDRPRNPDSDVTRLNARHFLKLHRGILNSQNPGFIIMTRSRNAQFRKLFTIIPNRDPRNFGAAIIKSDTHLCTL